MSWEPQVRPVELWCQTLDLSPYYSLAQAEQHPLLCSE